MASLAAIASRQLENANARFVPQICALATTDANARSEASDKLLAELEERYRQLKLLDLSRRNGTSTWGDDGTNSDDFVLTLNDLGMHLVQGDNQGSQGARIGLLEYRLAGLELLRCLMSFDDKNATTRRLEMLTLLHNVLENKLSGTIDKVYDIGTLLLAASVLAALARKADTVPERDTLRRRFIEPAMGWLNDTKHAVRRFSAALILKALAESIPTVFYEVHKTKGFFAPNSTAGMNLNGSTGSALATSAGSSASQAGAKGSGGGADGGGSGALNGSEGSLQKIWGAVRDKEKVEVRVHAAEAYGAFVDLVQEREREGRYYAAAIAEIDSNFEKAVGLTGEYHGSSSNSSSKDPAASGIIKASSLPSAPTELVHGALLLLLQLLRHPGGFMKDGSRYRESIYVRHVSRVLLHRQHKDDTVRQAVLDLIPRLAAFDIDWFGKLTPTNEKSLRAIFSSIELRCPIELLSFGTLSAIDRLID